MDHLPNDKPNKQTPNFSRSGLAIGAALGMIFSLMLFEDTALLAAGIVIGAAIGQFFDSQRGATSGK